MDKNNNEHVTPTINFDAAMSSEKGSERTSMDDVLERLYGEANPEDIVYKYIHTILTGNPLEQLFEFNHLSDTQKEAILALQNEVIERNLEKYRQRVQSLNDQISKLSNDKQSLEEEKTDISEVIGYLQKEVDKLKAEITSLTEKKFDRDKEVEDYFKEKMASVQSDINRKKQELASSIEEMKENLAKEVANRDETIGKLNSQINDLERKIKIEEQHLADVKEKGIHKVCEEINEERRKLASDVLKLKATKESLETSVNDLNDSYKTTTSKINRIVNGDDGTVEWEQVPSDDPIYSTSTSTIDDYIKTLKEAYAAFEGITYEESCTIFNQLAPGLNQLHNVLSEHLKNVYYRDENNKLSKCEAARKILANLKLPKYYGKGANKKTTVNPTLEMMKREIEFQKQALDAAAKQRAAEHQLEVFIEKASEILPKETLDELMNAVLNAETTSTKTK